MAPVRADRLAVLIDADNANAKLIEPLLNEIAKYGVPYVKRIYGDWTKPHLSHWKSKLNELAIQPIQQFSYTHGKNSTDSALIIDAMDLLYTRNFDGFCLVSSDSDFTRLASRLRESGLLVYGFGEKKTPQAFVSACDKFTYVEILRNSAQSAASHAGKHSQTGKSLNKKILQLFKDAYEAVSGEDEWIHLGPFGSQLNKLSPSFDPRNYGYSKLGQLVKASNLFEIKETPHAKKPAAKDIYIKLKEL
ncbi:MAG: NYN domain-containing protein [Leptolyngbya sp. SIO4C1]|nr:NYN domain-containing protein [Leptolyngbya sp. SIO4C1]